MADEVRELEAREEEIAAAIADGELTRDQLRTANRRLSERLTTKRHQLASVGGHRELARYLGKGDELRERWHVMTLDQRRAVIRAVVESVNVGPGTPGRRTLDPDRARLNWRV